MASPGEVLRPHVQQIRKLIGEGAIGVDAFRWLLADARTAGVPLVLETPSERKEVAEDDPSPDPADVRMIRLLESLLPS